MTVTSAGLGVFGVIGAVVLVAVVLWVLNLPGDDEDTEEALGFLTANWRRLRK